MTWRCRSCCSLGRSRAVRSRRSVSTIEDPLGISLLDHYRNPRNLGVVAHPSVRKRGNNPLCGDEVELTARLAPEGNLIGEIAFTSRGCSIVQASASIMTELVKGRSTVDVRAIAKGVLERLTGKKSDSLEALEEIGAIERAVRDYPIRVKCALLPWTTLREALDATPEGDTKMERAQQPSERHAG